MFNYHKQHCISNNSSDIFWYFLNKVRPVNESHGCFSLYTLDILISSSEWQKMKCRNQSGDKELAIYVIYQREVTHAGTLSCEIQTITNFTGLMDRF